MNLLYYHKDPLSNYFAAIREKNASEFRGAARGVVMSRIFRTFALILYNYRPRCGDLYNYKQFAAFVQKRLDTRPRCGYTGAGHLRKIVVTLLLAQETCFFCFICTKCEKKTWQILQSHLYWRRNHLSISSSHYYWRPRAKNPEKSSPAISKRDRGPLTR